MKIKFYHTFVIYFINDDMFINIIKEKQKIIKVVNDDAFVCSKHMERNTTVFGSRVNFLWNVLILTIKYPQIESYLKDLLNYFTIDELKMLNYMNWSILHHMSYYSSIISLNAFEMMINFCVNINIKDNRNSTAVHILLRNECNNHNTNILNLFIKCGIDLNIQNVDEKTCLDITTMYPRKLTDETKNCVMLLIDFGATTNKSYQNNQIADFIEYYKNSTIKPIIKNENKI